MFPLGQSPCNLFAHLDRWSCSPSFLLVSPWCVRCRPPPWYSTPRSDSRGGIGGGVGGGECFLVLPMELATMEMVWATTMVGKARGKEEGGRPEGGRREAATASAKSKDYIHHCERRRRSVTRSLARVGQRGAAAAAIRPTRETPRTDERTREGGSSLPPSPAAAGGCSSSSSPSLSVRAFESRD